MAVSPIRNASNSSSSQAAQKPRAPQGLAQTPDRLEKSPEAKAEEPPSLFKKFLVDPIIQIVKFILRGVFTFIDFLRSSAFEEKPAEPPLNRDSFLDHLRAAPRPETLLVQFKQVYSAKEQSEIYRSIGEAHTARVSWKEMIWNRSAQDNIELGRRLVRDNPFLLRDYTGIS